MRQDTRHIGAEEGVCEKEEHDCHHRQPDDSPRRLDDEEDADAADDDIGRRHRARARHELAVLNNDVGRRRRTEDGEDHIDGVKEVVPCPRAPKWIEQIRKCKAESKMDSALQLGVENAKGCRVELKDGKCNCNGGDNLLRHPLIVGGIRLAVVLLEHGLRSLLIGHRGVHILWENFYIVQKKK